MDVLEATGARRPRPDLDLATTPQSQVTGEQIMRPHVEIARAIGHLGDAAEKLAVPFAREAGEAAVTRDEHGNIKVETRAFEFSQADRAFNSAALQRAQSMAQTDASRLLSELHQKHLGDPGGFAAASEAVIKNLAKSLPPQIRGVVEEDARRIGAQHLSGIGMQVARASIERTRTGLLAQIEDNKNQVFAFARQTGLDLDASGRPVNREIGLLWERVADGYEALRTNPLYGYDDRRIKSEIEQFQSQARAEGIVGQVDQLYTKRGRAEAAKDLTERVLNNPTLNLPNSERSRLFNWGMARLAYLDGETKAAVAAHRQTVTTITTNLAGKIPVPDAQIDDAIAQATRLGDSESVLKLQAARSVAGLTSGTRVLPDDQALKAYTGGSAGPSVVDRIIGVESGNDPGAKNPRSSATGLGQFTAQTWAQMIGATKPEIARGRTAEELARDPAVLELRKNADLAREMTSRLATENADRLRDAGLPVTPGTVYLSHFAGSAGARALLQAPSGEDAAAVMSRASGGRTPREALIRANPFLAGKTAGEVVAWADRRMGGSGESVALAPAGGKTPFTPEQLAANPFLGSTWLRSHMADEKAMIDTAGRVAGSIEEGLKKGFLPNPETLAAFMQVAEQHPDKLAARRDELVARVAAFQDADGALGIAGGAGASLVAQAQAMAQGGSILQQQYAGALKDSYERGVRALQDDPWTEAARRQWTTSVPGPLDLTSTATLQAGLQARAQLAMTIGARTGNPRQSALAPADVATVAAVWNGGSPDQKVAVLSAIGTLPEPLLAPTLHALAKDKEAGLLAFVAGLTREAPETASAIMRGQAALAQNPKLAPKPETWAKNIETALPISVVAPESGEARRMMGEAIRATYAHLSARDGDESGDENPTRMDDAVKIVTGGMVEHNGSKVLPPKRGMTQADFDRVMTGLADQDFAGAGTASGLPVTARDARSSFVLRGISDGRYILQAKSSPASFLYVRGDPERGGPPTQDRRFILDLKGREPPPPAAAAAAPAWFDFAGLGAQ